MKKVSKDDLINDVKRVFKETQNTTRENYLKYGKYSRAPIKRLFGGWNDLLKELDVPINMHKKLDKEEILKEMRDLLKKHGKLTAEIQRKESTYSQIAIDHVFGSFTNLCKELDISIDGRFVPDEQIKEELTSINEEFGFISFELLNNFCSVSRQTITNRFGSLKNLCEELGISTVNENSLSKLSIFVLGITTSLLGESPIFEKTFSWLKNDKTGHNLFIDAYYPSYNLAIEVDGKQHYVMDDFFYNSIEDFDESIYRDNLKEKLLKEHNIHLIRISYKDKVNDITSKINSFLSNS